METVFDALKALKKASSHEIAARLEISRDDAVTELWKLKRRGEADNKGSMWWLTSEATEAAPKTTAEMLINAIEQHGPQSADELALMFGITSRRANSSLAMAVSKGRLIRVNQDGKYRYCIPGDNLPAEPKAASVTETDGKAFPQPKHPDGLILPSLHVANRELRRAKGQVQKWERLCAALREINKHRDVIQKITTGDNG
ncbi:DUF1627 domain-containing protein [Escherichia coli]|uniref:DUF1627 domain-containing protein n=1 Tax=Escherichia coli TaxID=562 RepID=UPI00085A14AC|nr:DUF1627 domain-containing protein [Escherichia coli]